MNNILKKLLSFFRKPEGHLDPRFRFAPMRHLDKQSIKSILREWILFIDSHEPVPEDIVALNFNLWEATEETGNSCYTIELTGARHYDPDDDDWACDEDFEPRERNCDSLQLCSKIPWEEVLNILVDILKELKEELKDTSIFRVEHVTAGFTDGELRLIK